MDLKLKEVSELLSVSESTLKEWAQEGKVPSYELGGELRFSRIEMEDWLLNQKLDEHSPVATGDLKFSLYKAIHHGQVLTQVEAESKEELIATCMKEMAKHFDLDAGVLTDLFIDRERMMPTGVGHGIAIPHTRDFLLNSHFDVVQVVYLKKPLDYGALDGEPVHTCFFLFSSHDRRHLNLISKIAHLSSGAKAREFLQSHPSKNELLTYIKKWEAQLT